MGGRKNQNPQTWKDSHKEQYWRGAWALSPRSQANQQPRYDQVQLGGRGSKGNWDNTPPWSRGLEGETREQSTAQAVQKELTSAKKADSRLRRLHAEKELRAKQWEKFKDDQKRNFLKQRQLFGEDVERLDAEMQQAAEAGRAAAERMKLIVLQGVESVRAPAAEAGSFDMEWERMMSAEEEVTAPSAFLRDALRAAQSVGQSVPGGPGPDLLGEITGPPAAERLPSFGVSLGAAPAAMGASPAQPSPTSLPPEPLLVDPYTGSSPTPSTPGPDAPMATERRTSPIHPGQRAPGAPRVPTNVEAPRPGIKPATSAPNQVAHPGSSGVSLADKLDAKRSVLEPFGGARPPAPPGLPVPGPSEAELAIAEARALALNQQGGTPTPNHPAMASASIVSDDDGDELT